MIVACLALVVALGGTAIAAKKIGSGAIRNDSLKSVDLKNNAGVKGADIGNSSLQGADFGQGSLNGGDVADDSLGGTDVAEASLGVSQVIARLGGTINEPVASGLTYLPVPNRVYTLAANESQEIVGGGQVTFEAGCVQPRQATLYMLVNDPLIAPTTIAGIAQVSDTGAGQVTRSINFGAFPGGASSTQVRRGVAAEQEVFFYSASSCSSGGSVIVNSLAVDVIGHR